MFISRLALLPACVVGMSLMGHTDGIVLEFPGARLSMDAAHGNIQSLLDSVSGHEHLVGDERGALWILDFADEHGGALTPEDAGSFSWQRSETSSDELELIWRDFDRHECPRLAVHVLVKTVPDGPGFQWDIALRNLEEVGPRVVRFPRIPTIASQPDEVLAVPYWIGEKTRQARQLIGTTGGHREWSYPGLLSMQCITLYQENGPGLYLSANDIHARSKRFAVFGDGRGGLGLEVHHFPGADSVKGGRYTPGYQTTLGLFNGDWITVAEIYRRWALQQPWARDSRLKQGSTPAWVTDTGFWVWNRGPSPGVLPPATTMQEYLGLPVSVFWHWWHGCAYDVGFPEYLPPREGADHFRDAVADARATGINPIVYMNQRLWGMTTDSWTQKDAARFAVKEPDGTVRPKVYNSFTKSPNASMCMGTAFWRDTYADLSDAVFNALGVSGIYMDQACSSLVCYDPNHEHAPGGGTYWMEGFRALESNIRERCPGVALAGEGTGEAWLPHLDLMLSLQVSMERYAAPGQWEPIPFFHAVYHGYTVLYGNYASLTYPPYDALWPPEFAPESPLKLMDEKFRRQFRLEHARAFVWGQQPCLANFMPEQLTERAQDLDFIKRLALLRKQALPHLLHGTFMRPPTIDIPNMEIPISRLSIYAGQQDAVQEYTKEVPQLLIAAWRDDAGSIAVPVVNISNAPYEMVLRLSTDVHGLPNQGTIYKITPENRSPFASFKNGITTVKDNLAPAEACIYVFMEQENS